MLRGFAIAILLWDEHPIIDEKQSGLEASRAVPGVTIHSDRSHW